MNSDVLQFGPPPKAPLSRRTKTIVASAAAVVLLAGATILGIALYRGTTAPSTADIPASVVMANDGKTQLAQLGSVMPLKEGDAQLAAGNIVNHVYAELHAQAMTSKDLKSGGYRITTTIDPQAQKLLEQYARPDLPGSELAGRKVVTGADAQDLESAGVAIDHATGRVLAYYGGIDGTATDQAGVNTGGNGDFGGHPPGGSMQIYTLAAALEAGASLNSHWKAMPFTTDDGMRIGNAGVPNTGCKDYCTLEYSLMKSYHVPFYWVARQIGPGAVVRTANQAGVKSMWDTSGRESLKGLVQGQADRAPFDRQVGFGQYPVTTLDHAAGVATFANGGVANTPHFVLKVEKFDAASGAYKVVAGKGEQLAPRQVVQRAVADDVGYAMQKALADRGGWASALNFRPAAVIPGVWGGQKLVAGKATPSSENSDAWLVGFTQQISVAVWTGNAVSAAPVTDPKTKSTITSNTAFRIWSGFVNSYSAAAGYPKAELAGPSHTGSEDFAGANGVKAA